MGKRGTERGEGQIDEQREAEGGKGRGRKSEERNGRFETSFLPF
jgi:hypothetical protein